MSEGFINDDQLKSDLLRLLLIRHKFVDAVAGGTGEGDHSKWSGLKRSLSRAKMSVRIRLRKKVTQDDFYFKSLR